jgi:translocator protein
MKIIQLVVSIAIAQVAGLIGSFFTISSVNTWYVDLAKPLWNPPAWLFGPVWVTLYTLMGIAAYLIWRYRENPKTKRALIVYGLQLVLNALWSILFFGLQNPGLAFLGIIVLLVFIIITTIKFWKLNTWAGILLLPYLVWVSFAMVLNYTIWQLN